MKDDDIEPFSDLGFETPWGTIESFETIGWGLCVDCECEISEENSDGWEVFVEATKTQKICRKCQSKRDEYNSTHVLPCVDSDGILVAIAVPPKLIPELEKELSRLQAMIGKKYTA